MSAPTVLVTGATGFLGSSVSRALVQAGYRVRALHRASSFLSRIEDLPVELIQGDLFDAPSISRAARGADFIVHCAGLVSEWRDAQLMTKSHVIGTRNTVRAAMRQRVRRFVHVSSVAALGVPRPGSADETRGMTETHLWNVDRLFWPYGYAKHRAEDEVWQATAAGLEAVIALPSYILSPGQTRVRGGGLLARALAHGVPTFALPGGLNVVHIQDVVEGLLALLEHGATGERYLLVGHNLSLRSYLSAVAEASGGRPPRRQLPAAPLQALGQAAARLRQISPWIPARLPMLALTGRGFYYDDRHTRAQLSLAPPRPYKDAIAPSMGPDRGPIHGSAPDQGPPEGG